MSYSRHNIQFSEPLCDIQRVDGSEKLVSERKFRVLLEEQYRKGFEAGERALSEQLIAQRKQLLEIQNGVLRSLELALPNVIAECEQSLVLLALESARRVVHNMPISVELLESTVRDALAHLKDTAEYEVLLHPDDLALLTQVQSDLLPPPGHLRIRFSPDPRMNRGDCVIHTRHGSIAATREQMFTKMEQALLC